MATGAALAVSSQLAGAVTQQTVGRVDIQPRDIVTEHGGMLYFGEMKVGTAGGTITLSNDGTHTFTVAGDVVHLGEGYEGRVKIQGEQNHNVTVTVDGTFTLSATTLAEAGDLTVTTNPQSDTFMLQAANGEWNYFHIGGTLTIPENQPADIYTGEYNVTVNYQ